MKIVKHSHKGGNNAIAVGLIKDIEDGLGHIKGKLCSRCAPQLRADILDALRHRGWSDKVRISSNFALTLTAMNGRIALCLQTGNMARFYADLLKLQAQFLDEKINAAIYIVPMKDAAKRMGQNMANFERMISELKNLFDRVITVPIIILGFNDR